MWDTIVIQPFTNVLLLITMLVKNFGIAIILFTLLIKLITNPLTASGLRATKKVNDLYRDPRYIKIQEKYKDDKERLAQEQMKLYQELKINPLGSCLPTLIQLPIVIGLYQSIMKAMAATPLELVKLERLIYPFLDPVKILPIQNRFLWMDLGQPERLMIGGIGIPVLAILVVATTFIQSRVAAPPTSSNSQTDMMAQSMNIYMPILMGWLAYTLSSGLALYFLVSNIVSVVQYAAQGQADWSRVFPWVKNKKKDLGPVKLPELVSASLDEDLVEASRIEAIKKEAKPSARASVKKQRPQMKR